MSRYLSILCCLFVAGCAVSADEPLEPRFEGPGLNAKADGFSQVETSNLDFGQTATGEFDEDFQFFAYEFAAREDAEIRAEVSRRGSSSRLDTVMFLYRLSDTEEPSRIAVDRDSGWGALSRIDDFRLYSEGNYAFVIGTADSAGRGNFTVALDCLSGECGPVNVPVPTCPTPMQKPFFDCVSEIGAGSGFEVPLWEASEYCTDDEEVFYGAYSDVCFGIDEPAWCAEGQSGVAETCGEFVDALYPGPGDLGSRTETVASPTLDTFVNAANNSDDCAVSEDAGCQVEGKVYRYEGAAPSMPQIFAFARTSSMVGPGILEDQSQSGQAGFDSFGNSFGASASLTPTLEAHGSGEGEFGNLTGDDFQWNYGDCQADAAVAHFPEVNTIIIVHSTFCAG
ncbi:MAG: hypothetical protein AAGF12_07480 [Myxococcota bacterium]